MLTTNLNIFKNHYNLYWMQPRKGAWKNLLIFQEVRSHKLSFLKFQIIPTTIPIKKYYITIDCNVLLQLVLLWFKVQHTFELTNQHNLRNWRLWPHFNARRITSAWLVHIILCILSFVCTITPPPRYILPFDSRLHSRASSNLKSWLLLMLPAIIS